MNLTALKPKSAKRADTNGHSKAIEPFYIDRQAEKQYAKESTNVLERLNGICYEWQSVNGKPVASKDEFDLIYDDAAKYWRSLKAQENIDKQNAYMLSAIEGGFDIESVQQQIKLPEGFDRVLDAVKMAKRVNINWKNFTWVENGFQLSAHYLNRVDGKVFFHAVTPLQQKRLQKAKELLQCIQDLEELMEEECREAGISEAKIGRSKKTSKWIGPLPYALRMEQTPDATVGWGSITQKVVINERWVTEGLKQYADVVGLPGLTAKDRHIAKPHTPVVYLKFTRRDMDGARRLYIVPKHNRDIAYFGMSREAEVKFLPGEFIIGENGKLIPNE